MAKISRSPNFPVFARLLQERRQLAQAEKKSRKARKRQERQERRELAQAQALSPPPQVSTFITRADSPDRNPSRASTIHNATPTGIENRPPTQTRVYSRPMSREAIGHLSQIEEKQDVIERPKTVVSRPGPGRSSATRHQHRPSSMNANVSSSGTISRPASSGSPQPQLASIANRPTPSAPPGPALAPVTNRPTFSRPSQSPLYSEAHLPRGLPSISDQSLPFRQRFPSQSQMSPRSSSSQPAGQENSPKLPPSHHEMDSEDSEDEFSLQAGARARRR